MGQRGKTKHQHSDQFELALCSQSLVRSADRVATVAELRQAEIVQYQQFDQLVAQLHRGISVEQGRGPMFRSLRDCGRTRSQ